MMFFSLYILLVQHFLKYKLEVNLDAPKKYFINKKGWEI